MLSNPDNAAPTTRCSPFCNKGREKYVARATNKAYTVH